MTRVTPRSPRLGLAALVLVAAVVPYLNSLSNGFALDDNFVIRENPRVHGVEVLDRAVSEPYWPNAPGSIGLWRPLTSATYALQWEVWQDQPLAYHAVNVGLHAAVSLLLFSLLSGLVGPLAGAAGALVFAVHPVHTEAVANVVGRAELLAALAFLAAARLYLGPVDPEPSDGDSSAGLAERIWIGAGVGALYFLGLAAKEIAVTLPAALLVLEWLRVRQSRPGPAMNATTGNSGSHRTWRRELRMWMRRLLARWPTYGALAGSLLLYLAFRSAVLGTPVGNDEAGFLRGLGELDRVWTAVSIWPEYLRLMLFPADLVADYSPGVLMPVEGFGTRPLVGLLVGILVAAIAVRAARPAPMVTGGIAWFALTVLPVSNLIIPIGVLLAERTLYLPSVGVALAVAGVMDRVGSPRRTPGAAVDRVARPSAPVRQAAWGVLAALVIAGGVRSWVRNPVWHSSSTVLQTLARDHPESFRVQWILADQLARQGRLDDALARYALAVDLVPYHYQLRIDYGNTLLDAGRPTHAARQFDTARVAVPSLPDAHVLLIHSLLLDGEPHAAVDAAERAAKMHPDHPGVHHQRAIALARAGRWSDALEARQTSIRLAGARAPWGQYVHLAELRIRTESADFTEALAEARRRAPADAAVPSPADLTSAIEADDPSILPYR